MVIRIRPLSDDDLDLVFAWQCDPHAVHMAAFTRADPSDRAAFDAHQARIAAEPSATQCSIDADGRLVGTIGSFEMDGDREVTYWIDPDRWGQGLASQALAAYLALETTRPLYGRVAEHNVASAKVLRGAGFVQVGAERAFAAGIGAEIVEHIYRLDQ